MDEKERAYLDLILEARKIFTDLIKYGDFYGSAIEMEQYPEDGNWQESDGRRFEERITEILYRMRREELDKIQKL